MYDENFRKYIAEQLNKNPLKIDLYFDKHKDVFEVAKDLIEKKVVSQQRLGEIWASYNNVGYVNPNNAIIDESYFSMLGIKIIQEYYALPLYKFGKAVTVATSAPENPYLLDKLEKKLDTFVSFVFCFPFEIDEYIQNITK